MVLPSAREIKLQVLAEVGAVRTVLALVATGVGCTILPESAVNALGDEALPSAPIGPPSIWNALVLATPLARPATRLTRSTAQLLQELDFRGR
jgi:LysR family nitrogen assimilation transcriptional regulator